MELCNHGYFAAHCAPCVKRQGECDYGACERDAIMIVHGSHESRPACSVHAPVIVVA